MFDSSARRNLTKHSLEPGWRPEPVMPGKETHPIRILIADDHPVMCSGLSNMLNPQETMAVIGTTGSGSEALKFLAREKLDLMLLDLRMPDGISVLRALQSVQAPPKVLVIKNYEHDELIYQAIKAGAQGYLVKDTSETEPIAATTVVHAGRRYIPIDIAARFADSDDEIGSYAA